MISLTNNSSTTTQKLQAFLSGAAATTNPTVTVVSYIVPPQAKPDYSEYRRAPQFTILAGATETDIADAPPSGSVKDIIYIAIYNSDTAAVTVTVCVDDNATNRIECKVTLGVASTLYYEDGRGWYVVDANGGEVSSTSEISGSWTPTLTFATPGDLNVVYSTRVGTFSKIGTQCFVTCNVRTSTFTHTTASGAMQITGLPFTSFSTSNANASGGGFWQGITLANYTQIVPAVTPSERLATFVASGSAQNINGIDTADTPTAGNVILDFSMTYRTA